MGFFLVLFLKTGELLGLVHCMTGRTRTSSTDALRQRELQGNDLLYQLLGFGVAGPSYFLAFGGGDTSRAHGLGLLVQEVTAKRAMQHFSV